MTDDLFAKLGQQSTRPRKSTDRTQELQTGAALTATTRKSWRAAQIYPVTCPSIAHWSVHIELMNPVVLWSTTTYPPKYSPTTSIRPTNSTSTPSTVVSGTSKGTSTCVTVNGHPRTTPISCGCASIHFWVINLVLAHASLSSAATLTCDQSL